MGLARPLRFDQRPPGSSSTRNPTAGTSAPRTTRRWDSAQSVHQLPSAEDRTGCCQDRRQEEARTKVLNHRPSPAPRYE
ncbi:MAG TPA: hypothetical protein PK096_03370 [Candidatus Saccharibacteria bacterium]|nr:hypothetical protein [Candidatus Saccharibacteria bacterium]HRK94383.1 hypothetical protein [Candidatus Saccharibacteria bacterium]